MNRSCSLRLFACAHGLAVVGVELPATGYHDDVGVELIVPVIVELNVLYVLRQTAVRVSCRLPLRMRAKLVCLVIQAALLEQVVGRYFVRCVDLLELQLLVLYVHLHGRCDLVLRRHLVGVFVVLVGELLRVEVETAPVCVLLVF